MTVIGDCFNDDQIKRNLSKLCVGTLLSSVVVVVISCSLTQIYADVSESGNSSSAADLDGPIITINGTKFIKTRYAFLDILFLVDRSSERAIKKARDLVLISSEISMKYPGCRFGLSYYSDFRCTDRYSSKHCKMAVFRGEEHVNPEGCYQIDLPMQDDYERLVSRLRHIFPLAESQQNSSALASMMLATVDTKMEWNNDTTTTKLIILITEKKTSCCSHGPDKKVNFKGDGTDTCETTYNPEPFAVGEIMRDQRVHLFLTLRDDEKSVFLHWRNTLKKVDIRFEQGNWIEGNVDIIIRLCSFIDRFIVWNTVYEPLIEDYEENEDEQTLDGWIDGNVNETVQNVEKSVEKPETNVIAGKNHLKSKTDANTLDDNPKSEADANNVEDNPKSKSNVNAAKDNAKSDTNANASKDNRIFENDEIATTNNPKSETDTSAGKDNQKSGNDVKVLKENSESETSANPGKDKPNSETDANVEKGRPVKFKTDFNVGQGRSVKLENNTIAENDKPMNSETDDKTDKLETTNSKTYGNAEKGKPEKLETGEQKLEKPKRKPVNKNKGNLTANNEIVVESSASVNVEFDVDNSSNTNVTSQKRKITKKPKQKKKEKPKQETENSNQNTWLVNITVEADTSSANNRSSSKQT